MSAVVVVTQAVPLATIKLLAVLDNVAILVKLALYSCTSEPIVKPNLSLVSAPVVVTQEVPLATIKLFAVLDNAAILVKLADTG